MKKALLILIGISLTLGLFGESKSLKRKVEKKDSEWILNENKSQAEKVRFYDGKKDCGEGVFFVFDKETNTKFLVDKKMNKLSEKEFMHVGFFSDGKTVVSGFQEERYETDRIYDVKNDSVSEPIPNMWVYCAFVDGLGAFSIRNSQNELKSVLVDLKLKNVAGIEFDEFCELDFERKIWHFRKNTRDYYIDKDGKFIERESYTKK